MSDVVGLIESAGAAVVLMSALVLIMIGREGRAQAAPMVVMLGIGGGAMVACEVFSWFWA